MIIILVGVLSDEEKGLINDIFKDTNELLYNISFSILHSAADAEDAVATTYLKIMDHIEKICKLSSPQIAPYCVTIVKNTSIDILRKRKRDVLYDSIEPFEDISGTEEIWNVLDIRELHTFIERLNRADRYIINLHYGNGLGYAEIAGILEISEEAAKKRGQRALKNLRKLFEEGAFLANGV